MSIGRLWLGNAILNYKLCWEIMCCRRLKWCLGGGSCKGLRYRFTYFRSGVGTLFSALVGKEGGRCVGLGGAGFGSVSGQSVWCCVGSGLGGCCCRFASAERAGFCWVAAGNQVTSVMAVERLLVGFFGFEAVVCLVLASILQPHSSRPCLGLGCFFYFPVWWCSVYMRHYVVFFSSHPWDFGVPCIFSSIIKFNL